MNAQVPFEPGMRWVKRTRMSRFGPMLFSLLLFGKINGCVSSRPLHAWFAGLLMDGAVLLIARAVIVAWVYGTWICQRNNSLQMRQWISPFVRNINGKATISGSLFLLKTSETGFPDLDCRPNPKNRMPKSESKPKSEIRK